MYDLDYLSLKLLEEIRDIFLNPFEWSFFSFLFLVSFFSYRSKKILAIGVFLLAIVWAWYSRPLYLYLQNIGTDSLFEARSFDLAEAKAYLHLLFVYLVNYQQHALRFMARVFLLLSSSLLLALLLHYLTERIRFLSSRKQSTVSVFCATLLFLAVLPVGMNLYPTWVAAREQSISLDRLFDVNDDVFSPQSEKRERALQLVTYIGESTSALNMGVYGYWRDTTPQLNKLIRESNNVFRVDDVFSTHTHTTPSLLEALSVPNIDAGRIYATSSIFEHPRISIIEILKKAGIRTKLLSNQGLSGTWNSGASVLFKNADNIELSAKELETAGNLSGDFPRLFDHEFFGGFSEFKDEGGEGRHSSTATFMHSYAGHMKYLRNIPEEFRHSIDGDLEKSSYEAIFGTTPTLLDHPEDYDSAIRYVDFSLSLIIEEVLASEFPTVLIYFSDHGDASFTGRGHDSSRFHFSMISVPMMIVINDVARTAYPDLHDELRNYVSSERTKTLRDVPKLIVQIFDIADILNDKSAFQFNMTATPVVMRHLENQITGVPLEFDQLSKSAFRGIDDARDDATRNFSSAKRFRSKNICYHRSNTIARAITGALSSRCIEFDIVVNGDDIHVTHPPANATGLRLKKLSQIVKGYKTSAWIDSKNINTAENCSKLYATLENIRDNFVDVLVEFPSNSPFGDGELNECISKFHRIDVQTSYYLPTSQVIDCANSVSGVVSVDSVCRELEILAVTALASDVQGLSFDFRGVDALNSMELPEGVKLHTWGIQVIKISG